MDTYTSCHASELQEGVIYMPPQIYWAAAQGDIDIIRREMDRADQYLTPNKNTILHIAAQFGQLNCVQRIIENYREEYSSALLQWPNLKGDSPLHMAAREGHLEIVNALICAARELPRTDIESGIEADKAMLRMTNNDNDTALHEAVRYHHPQVVKLLTQEDLEFTYGANFSGGTPLYMAAERGFTDLVKIIIENTTTLTPPPHTGPFGRTALHAAVISRDPKMVEELLKWNRDLTKEVDENGWSPLHCAAYLGCDSIAGQLLLSSDRSVVYLRVKNDDNKTALHIAATRGNVSTAKRLVSTYPDCCEQVDINGNNALHLFMMQSGNFNKLLKIPCINVGSLVNEKNVRGQTPLHMLANSQRRIGRGYIKNKKVDKMALNNENMTPMDIILLAEDLFGGKVDMVGTLRLSKATVGPLYWEKAMSKDENKKPEDEKNKDKSESRLNKGFDSSFFRKASESHLLVAALVATVSFAAGFTLPGGYNDSDGMAILRNKPAFGAFVVADSMALVLSVAAVFFHFYIAISHNKNEVRLLLSCAFWLTNLGLVAMVIAFSTNLYTVLPHHSGIAIFTFIICVFCSVFIIISIRKPPRS